MTISSVEFHSEVAATRITPTAAMAMISIADPGRRPVLQDGWGALLTVSFADAAYSEETIQQYGRMWPLSSLGFPVKDHALAILSFLDNLPSAISILHVHCGAGESRSAAVAKYAAERYGLPFPDDYRKANETVYRLLRRPDVFDDTLAVACPPRRKSLVARLFHW